jgi:hypothetical protein
MVIGLDTFREYFKDYTDSYIIIGGTACDLVIDAAGFTPRATNDIDIILVVQAMNAAFVEKFWQFIKDGNYKMRERNEEERKYYRFTKPETEGFPHTLELFSKVRDTLDLPEEAHLTPIPVDEGQSNLSAILMDEDYYQFTITNSEIEDEVRRANKVALICLKAKAYLENKRLKSEGKPIRTKDVVKHKYDVFRLTLLLAEADKIETTGAIYSDMKAFIDDIKNDLPTQDIFDVMQVGVPINVQALFEQLIKNFNLDTE